LTEIQGFLGSVNGLSVLVVPFTLHEIDGVVEHLKPDKALGPYGFNGNFLKYGCPIIKGEFVQLIGNFIVARPLYKILMDLTFLWFQRRILLRQVQEVITTCIQINMDLLNPELYMIVWLGLLNIVINASNQKIKWSV
jgi:hypothetical protein